MDSRQYCRWTEEGFVVDVVEVLRQMYSSSDLDYIHAAIMIGDFYPLVRAYVIMEVARRRLVWFMAEMKNIYYETCLQESESDTRMLAQYEHLLMASYRLMDQSIANITSRIRERHRVRFLDAYLWCQLAGYYLGKIRLPKIQLC